MARSTLTGLARAGALAVACLGVLPGGASAGYTSLYVFGDSLSDPGNLFALAGQPGAPYVDGRFSNGPVAAEYLASRMQLGAGQVFNFAYGGAETGLNGALGSPTGVTSQVNTYTSMLAGSQADPTGLYMVWAGANDLLSLFSGPPPSDAQVNSAVANAVSNLAGAVGTLYQAGARDFLLPLLPDLGATPRLNGSPLVSAGASALSTSFNLALLGAYNALGANPAVQGEQFFVFNTPAAQAAAATALVQAGGNATNACLGAAPAPACTGFFYFDDIHPTTAMHEVLAGGLAAAANVPEPGSLLLAGTAVAALLSASSRRRRQRAAA